MTATACRQCWTCSRQGSATQSLARCFAASHRQRGSIAPPRRWHGRIAARLTVITFAVSHAVPADPIVANLGQQASHLVTDAPALFGQGVYGATFTQLDELLGAVAL